ncbi:hypothetical protein LP52_02455 [Streptomonospora alba]|uniref:HTH luxR-type domain-containing protein n=1 Tax=Streptomonospora alba TaxID=183763 RepID=A0A0C2JML9_9ACTN|nr:LuxR family transcriptional regulator [Streptomonospora alba]KII00201.1 hypothetical protein LP52_02455 [Streptomonospora alba]
MIDRWCSENGPAQSAREPFGRSAPADRVADIATSPEAASLALVTGPMGIGRSTVLAKVESELAARGVAALSLRVPRSERDRPYSLALRLHAELGALNRDRGAGYPAKAAVPTPGPDAGRRMVSELRSAIGASGRLTILIDDAQWADPGSRAVLLQTARALAGGPATLVCAFRPSPADPAEERGVLDRLRAAGLAEEVPVPPLRQSQVRALVARQLQADPSEALMAYLRRECRGRPAAVLAAVAGYQRSGAVRVFDRNAYLVSPDQPPLLPAELPSVTYLRQLGTPVWPVAKAMAVLHPLGPAAIGLVAVAADLDEDQVRDALSELYAEGVLRYGPGADRWRFRLPLLASALSACLGPYERRRSAQVAVSAVWADEAVADSGYLAEQLVAAGRFVDSRRASDELLATGAAAMLDDGYRSERWLRAAVELAGEPEQRARALLAHAAACCIHLRYADAVNSARTVLSDYADAVPPEALIEIEMIYVISLGGTFDTEALTEICDGGWRSLPGGEGHRLVARCAALCHLDRWRDAHELVEAGRDVWSRDIDMVAALGQLVSESTGAYLGRTEAFDRAVAAPSRWPLWEKGMRHRFERLAHLARTLLLFGERDRTDRMLAAHEPPTGYWPVPDRVVLNSQAGHWAPALDLVRLSLATGLTVGDLPSHTLMWRETSIILGARGQLTRAREAIERAQSAQSLMLHLLAVPDAYLSRALGAPERVGRIVADALAYADERGLIVGTDELWLMTALSEADEGDPVVAQRYVEETEKVAGLLGTSRAELCHLTATAVVHRDRAAAAEAVRFARRRALPLESADTIGVLVRHGLADASLLHEAYAVYGDLGALLRRAQARILMREHGVAMPRRAEIIAENERLLATLVTEGLTNRELAVVLGDSEKSVESRLSRLFKRTGYRSRAELASAMLAGEYL